METIILKDAAAGGRLLGARYSAHGLRDRVERLVDADGAVSIDFGGTTPTQSFVDELVGVLVIERGERILDSLVFKNCSSTTKAILHFVISDRIDQVRSKWEESACC